MTFSSHPTLDIEHAPDAGAQLLETAKAHRELPIPEPPFMFRVRWANHYDDLLSADFGTPAHATTSQSHRPDETQLDDLLPRALASGRVFLLGQGGAGKTVVLSRLFRSALEQSLLPIYVNLKHWTSADFQAWDALSDSPIARVEFLLRRFGNPTTSLTAIEKAAAVVRPILMVDALNEVKSVVADSLLDSLSAFVLAIPASAVIVADRLVRRNLRGRGDWSLARILPLSEEEVDRQLRNRDAVLAQNNAGVPRSLIQLPYFLNELIHQGAVPTSSAEVFRRYFQRHVTLTDEELRSTAEGAFRAYDRSGTRTFALTQFERIAGSSAVRKLLDSGALRRDDGNVYFDHHLKHDYLVSRYVASSPKRWNHETLNVATFFASSFDTLELVLEELKAEQADTFVRRVYDWNPYAAAYVVAEAERRESALVSPEMVQVMLATLAERRWDIIKASAQRASDALEYYPSNIAERYRNTKKLSDVFRRLEEFTSDQAWFREWRKLFTRQADDRASAEDLELLRDQDSIIGWTLANVLKRLRLDERQQSTLRSVLRHDSSVIRWRAAHVLGAWPSEENARALARTLDADDDILVRYGAVRSLVEIAARGARRLRKHIFDVIGDSSSELMTEDLIQDEFTRAIFIRRDAAPSDWVPSVRPLLISLYQESTDAKVRQKWLNLLYQVEAAYSS